MAAKSGSKTKEVQGFLKAQLEEAQKKFQALETDAEKALKGLVTRGRQSRKEIEALIKKVNKVNVDDLNLDFVLANPKVKQLSKKAAAAGNGMRKQLDTLQTRVVEASGVASQHQVKELKNELNRLGKKIDALVGKKPAGKTDARA